MAGQTGVDFGSDAFFRDLKAAWRSNPDRAAEMIGDQVDAAIRAVIADPELKFGYIPSQEYEDYFQEAWIRVWTAMEGFLDDPLNDPDSGAPDRFLPPQKFNWLKKIVFYEMRHTRRRKLGRRTGPDGKPVSPVSVDEPVGDPNDGVLRLDFIASPDPGPANRFLAADSLADAFAALFSLPNETATLAAVALMMAEKALGRGRSLEEYASDLSGKPVSAAADEIARLLSEWEIDPYVLEPLRKRLRKESPVFGDLAPARLANRKNSVLDALRKKTGPDGSERKKGLR